MTAPGRTPCRWSPGTCTRDAVALVRHPGEQKPVPTCQHCIDLQRLEQSVVARLVAAIASGDPLPSPPARHAAEHYFKGVCICPCGDCTERVGEGLVMCTCPGCPADKCGAKAPTSAGVR